MSALVVLFAVVGVYALISTVVTFIMPGNQPTTWAARWVAPLLFPMVPGDKGYQVIGTGAGVIMRKRRN